jgi:hypothetical protein
LCSATPVYKAGDRDDDATEFDSSGFVQATLMNAFPALQGDQQVIADATAAPFVTDAFQPIGTPTGGGDGGGEAAAVRSRCRPRCGRG